MMFSTNVKRSFTAGLLLITPLVVTVYILSILVNWSQYFLNPIVRGTRLTQYTANVEVIAQIVAVGLIVSIITLLGYVAQRSTGRRMFGNIGRIVNVIPLVNTVYTSVRQVSNSLVERNSVYEGVVLVEYPRNGIYSIGLVTGEGPQTIEEFAGQDVYTVFLPNSPNPTGGRLVFLPADQVHEIDMSVGRGMRLLVTTGMGEESQSPGLARFPN